MKTERTIEILLKFVNSEITHNSNDAYCNITDIDYAVEQESTADGFSVYTFKHPDDEVCISENLYYYDSDLTELIIDALLDGGAKIYIDEYMYDDLYIESELENRFEEFADEIIRKAIEQEHHAQLTKQELKELKEEYEYEDEETETT